MLVFSNYVSTIYKSLVSYLASYNNCQTSGLHKLCSQEYSGWTRCHIPIFSQKCPEDEVVVERSLNKSSPATIKLLITYLNTPYKWFTTCFLCSNSLMQKDSRGAKKECGGRWIVCLQIARFFMQDRYKQNLSRGWINVRKAFDSADHLWLRELFAIHRFQEQIGRVVYILDSRWNTRIVVRTKQGVQTSDHGKNALRKVLVTLSTSNLAYRVKVEIKRKSTNFLSTSMNFQPACVATVHTFIVFKELQYEIVKMQTKIPGNFQY